MLIVVSRSVSTRGPSTSGTKEALLHWWETTVQDLPDGTEDIPYAVG